MNPAASRQKYLKYLYSQYQKGVLGPEKIELLIKEGFIVEAKPEAFTSHKEKIKVEKQWEDMMNPFYEAHLWIGYKKDITKKDWMPASVLQHTPEFVAWINSMLYGFFPNKINYKLFDIYKAQAYRWLQEDDNITNHHTEDAKRAFKQQEYNRCNENKLYYVNRYGELKEGDISSGFVKYQAREHHAVICYLFDCGYNVIGGKGRQIGWTSIMGLLADNKMIFQSNYYIKFITEDKDTGEEIFTDKIKYPFGALPRWMQPKVKSDSGTRFWLSDKARKGEKGYPNSRIDVVAPKQTAINGGSPQLVLIDEIGNIGILGAMLNEGRPTMFWNNPSTGKFELKRQVIMWGCLTAGNKVWTNNGDLVNIEDLKQKDGIIGYDGNGAYRGTINGLNPPAKKPCYKITTSGGNWIECSNDHPILWSRANFRYCRDGIPNLRKVTFKKAEEIKVGDHLAQLAEVPVFGNKRVSYARLLGLLIGDGNYSQRSNIQLSVADEEIRNYVKNNFKTSVHKSFILKNGSLFESVGILGFMGEMRKHGLYGQSWDTKRLPDDIYTFDEASVCELLGGYYDADGNVAYNEKLNYIKVVLSSTNIEILQQVKFLLHKLGIGGIITKENRSENGVKISAGQKDYIYRLYVTRKKDVLRFHSKIKLLCNYKQVVLNNVLSLSVGLNCRNNDKADYIINNNYPEKGEYFNGMKDMKHLRYEMVTKVEYVGEKEVYNLNVSETHTYLANGFITANTGGKMEKGKGEYEKEWYRILGLWEAKQYDNGFVPLFFSWHCRFDKVEYEKEKNWYYGARAMKEDIDLETSKTQFHQHYPSNFKDMFLTTASTLVSREIIEGGLNRCRDFKPQPIYGYFEPVFDELDPQPPESDLPYRLIDAKFVVIDDTEDFQKASVCIFQKPEPGWEYRYWQGTDPIATETGHSKQGSAIWDDYQKTFSAVLNFRRQHDHKYTFLQTLLLGLYYDTTTGIKRGVKELTESNIGTNYMDYREAKGFFDSVVFTAQLPSKVAGGARLLGIDNKGNRASGIIDYLTEVLRNYHDRIYISLIFEQLTTFVQDLSKSGKEVWGPQNKLLHFDDVLYACAYAYICRLSHLNLQPTRKVAVSGKTTTRYLLRRTTDWGIERVPTKVPVFETFGDTMPALDNVIEER